MRRLRFFARNCRNFYLINREVYALSRRAALLDAAKLAGRIPLDAETKTPLSAHKIESEKS